MSGISPASGSPFVDPTIDSAADSADSAPPPAPRARTRRRRPSGPPRPTAPPPTASRLDVAVPRTATSTTLIAGLRVGGDAVAYLDRHLGSLGARNQDAMKRVLAEAGEIDGNWVLSLEEAKRVIEPVLGTRADRSRSVDDRIEGARRAVVAEKEREAKVRDGVDVVFNRTPGAPGLTETVIAELEAAVIRADGRPVDIHLMIFNFTTPAIGDKIAEIARRNPNANIRILADWTMANRSGGSQPSRLAEIARREGLSNLEVKFKKDQPYRWSASARRPIYDHTASLGLNHHKGFVTLIDGKPNRLVAGSFNWSPTANTENFENLMLLDKSAAANRAVMRHFEEEFEAMWNDGRVSLTPAEAQRHRRKITEELEARAGGAAVDVVGVEAGAGASLDVLDHSTEVDANDPSGDSQAALARLLGGGADGRRLAAAVAEERRKYGRFISVEDMADRVRDVATLPDPVTDALREHLAFGDGLVCVNEASAADLEAAGCTRAAAQAIVRARERGGDLETLPAAAAAAGLSPTSREWTELSRSLTVETRRVAFSARAPHEAAGDAGFAEINERKTVPVLGEDGVVRHESATLGAGALDMLRRAGRGETLKLATYGLSGQIPEYQALLAAARRGVEVHVVLNEDHNEAVFEDLKRVRDQEGLPNLKVRMSKRRVMHEKFLVHREGQDAFNGSANLSGSSSRKNAEDRFFVKNNAAIAAAFEARFDKLWAESVD